MMEAGALALLMLALLSTASAVTFYGDSIHFLPPQRNKDGTFTVTFYNRQNGRSSCQDQSSIQCEGGACTSTQKLLVVQTDGDQAQGRWCQSEGHTRVIIQTKNNSFALTDSGCCWESNVGGFNSWTGRTEVDLGTRSDTQSINRCPVTSSVSSLRFPQNCFSRIQLLAHDPDGDRVRCRYANESRTPANFSLDQATCTITSSGKVQTGVHVFEVMLEDSPSQNITVTYEDGSSVTHNTSSPEPRPLCKVKLQFSVQIFSPISSCEIGHVQPVFLASTPSHGEVLHATVGEKFQLFAQAQALHANVGSFQVSGPQNLSKAFKDDTLGKAEVTVSWTPQPSDLHRLVPVCFSAETNETQSEMRCVVVMVTQASIEQGKAFVQCFPGKMTVALEKASMPGIDVNFLKLKDPKCSLSSNSTHISGTMSYQTCGTEFEETGDFIVFKNEITSFELANEIITRRKMIKIGFSCQFPKSLSISSSYNLHSSDYIFTESNFGSFGYSFDIFEDGNFTQKVDPTAYPVEVKLMQMIYLGIEAISELPNVKLFVESCKATPDDNPQNSLSYDLIKNGCNRDETLKVRSSNKTAFNFEVQAFKFTGNFDQVYITCTVILCEADSPFSRCAQGCLKDPGGSRRRRRGMTTETHGHYITQGPLQFVQQPELQRDPNIGDNNDGESISNPGDASRGGPDVLHRLRADEDTFTFRELISSNIATIVFGSAFFVAVVILAVMVRYYRRTRTHEDTDVLIPNDGVN